MRSLRPVERLSEGQLRCADATVAKHHIVLGTVRFMQAIQDPSDQHNVSGYMGCGHLSSSIPYLGIQSWCVSKISIPIKMDENGLMTISYIYIYILFISPWHIYHHKPYVMIPFSGFLGPMDGPAKSCTSGRWASVIASSHPIVEVNPWEEPHGWTK